MPDVFFHAVEHCPLAISITDLQANILYSNSTFTRVTGYSSLEAKGQNESMLSNNTTPREQYSQLWQQLAANQTWSGRLINRKKDGETYLAEVLVAPILDNHNQPMNYLGIHRDLTKEYGLQVQVSNQKSMIETAINAAPMAIAVLDDTGDRDIVMDNLSYKTLQTDFAHQDPATLILDQMQQELGEHYQRQLQRNRNIVNYEARLVSPAGRPRWFSCSLTALSIDEAAPDAFFIRKQHHYLLLMINEITQAKLRTEEAQRNALRALMAEDALVENMYETLNGALHKLQEPVNLISAVHQIALGNNQHPQNQAQVEALATAVKAGQEALQSLRDAMPPRPYNEASSVNLSPIIRNVLGDFTERMLAEGIVVDWQTPVQLPPMLGVERRLYSLFKHLIENAIDAMDNVRGEKLLRIVVTLKKHGVHIDIEDNGPGIDQALVLKVFQPFFSTKGPKYASKGMGLAIAQEIINEHKGNVWVDNEYRTGCRIRVFLPSEERDERGQN